MFDKSLFVCAKAFKSLKEKVNNRVVNLGYNIYMLVK